MSNTPIEHVIVLMLENRSFDHMCGYWNRLPGGSGLTGEEFNHVDPTDTSTAKIHVHRKQLESMEGAEVNDYQRQLLDFIKEDVAFIDGPEGAPHHHSPFPMSGKIQALDRLIPGGHILTDFSQSRVPHDLGISRPQQARSQADRLRGLIK